MQSLTLDQFKATVRAGGVTGVTLKAQGSGFYVEIATRAGGAPAVLAKARSAEPRRFGTPTSAMAVLKDIGIATAKMDFARWDPDQKEVTQNRDSRAAAMRDAHQAAAHQKRLAAELQGAIDDPRPSLTTDQVLARFDEDIDTATSPAATP